MEEVREGVLICRGDETCEWDDREAMHPQSGTSCGNPKMVVYGS